MMRRATRIGKPCAQVGIEVWGLGRRQTGEARRWHSCNSLLSTAARLLDGTKKFGVSVTSNAAFMTTVSFHKMAMDSRGMQALAVPLLSPRLRSSLSHIRELMILLS